MNVWLLGNGFDLSHKLPTKYENFLHTMEFLINHKDEEFIKLGDIFGRNELRNNDKYIDILYKEAFLGYKTLSQRIQSSCYRFNNCFIEFIVDMAESNQWLSYFLKCFNRDADWIDFEKEIGSVVNAFKTFLNKEILRFDFRYFDSEQKQIFKHFNFFYKMLNSSDSIVKNDFLISKPYGSDNKVIDKEKIVKYLFDSLLDFTGLLSWYLNSLIEPLISDNLRYSYNHIICDADAVVSFNYTNTVEKMYNKKVCHLHGNDFRNIVLGINSDKDDSIESIDTLFLNFKKYYQRVRIDSDIDYLQTISEIKEKKSKKEENVSLYVWGHSLDITDEDIIREMFDLSDKIIIYYHEEYKIGDYIENLVKLYGRKGFDILRKDRHLIFKKIQ